MRKIGINSWHWQVPSEVPVSPEPCWPCCFNKYCCLSPVIVVANLMPVPKLHTKRLFLDNFFDFRNPFSFQSLLVFPPSKLFNVIHDVISFITQSGSFLKCILNVFPHLYSSPKINRSHLFTFKVLVNVISRYIPWPILSLLDQRSSIHTSSFQFDNPLWYTQSTVKQYSLS